MQGRGGAADEAEQNKVQPQLEERKAIGAEKFLGGPYPQPRRSVSPPICHNIKEGA
jgi:hypothetical protein